MKKNAFIVLILFLVVPIVSACTLVKIGDSQKTVKVNNVDELLDAISPNTKIILEPGIYNLSESSKYGKADTSGYYHWINYGFDFEYQLFIDGIDNLKFESSGAEIVTEPRSSFVISFLNCDNLSIVGIKTGHTEAADVCEGGVISIEHCNNVNISDCSLYGCGTTGLYSSNSQNIFLCNTDIYHCSVSGVSVSNSDSITINNCKFYDCGTFNDLVNAQGIFVLYGESNNILINNCEVFDNDSQTLVESFGNELRNIQINNLSVYRNRFYTLINCAGQLTLNNINLRDNSIDTWYGEDKPELLIDGSIVDEGFMVEKWGEQLSSAGIGIADVNLKEIDKFGKKEVHVTSTDEFLSAINSNTTIYIDVPVLNLIDASTYGENATDEWYDPVFNGKPYAWSQVYDGYQLCIGYIDNFNIVGGEIITEPRYANVLSFYGCNNVGLENVKLGHSPEQGQCCGGVLYLYCTDNIILENCDLYGCGIMGIDAEYTSNLNIQNTLIHDCSQQAGYFYNSLNIALINTKVINCPQPNFTVTNCTNFVWNNKIMNYECSFNAD